MKTPKLIVRLLLVIFLLSPSVEAFAAKSRLIVRFEVVNTIKLPRPRTEPISCMVDKEAGLLEISFMWQLGPVVITITDSHGVVADQLMIDTDVQRDAVLSFSNPSEIYELSIQGEQITASATF
jgi:hypothetical protein